MINIRIVEGSSFDDGTILHDTKMATAPRVGESITLRGPRHNETRLKVMEIEYVLDLRESGVSPEDDLTGVRVLVREIR